MEDKDQINQNYNNDTVNYKEATVTESHEEKSQANQNDKTLNAASLSSNHNFSSRLNSVSHISDILKAAVPYVDNKTKRSVNMMLQVTELANTFEELNHPSELSIMEVEDFNLDTEGMLMDMRKFCNKREQEFVDVVVNIVKAQKLYSTYSTITSSSHNSKDNGQNNYAKAMGLGNNGNMMDMLMNFLPPEQKSTFETLSLLMSSMT